MKINSYILLMCGMFWLVHSQLKHLQFKWYLNFVEGGNDQIFDYIELKINGKCIDKRLRTSKITGVDFWALQFRNNALRFQSIHGNLCIMPSENDGCALDEEHDEIPQIAYPHVK